MSSLAIYDSLKEKFGEDVIELVDTTTPYIEVKASKIREIALCCREDGYDSLICLSGLDTKGQRAETKPLPADAEKGTKPAVPEEAIAVVYHLARTAPGETKPMFALKVTLDRNNPKVDSIHDIWRVADWHEREAYDMYGITFEGHPNLTRILCPDDWVGWPLRKDYIFPTEFHGVPHERWPSGDESEEREGSGGN